MPGLQFLPLIAALFATPQQGQSASPAKPLAFDAASIKPAAASGPRGVPAGRDPGRIHYPAISLKTLLVNAYGVKAFQVSGPSWLDTERFMLDATMPPNTTKEQLQVMLRNLLAERFKLVVHRQSKESQVLALVLAKGGVKMKVAAAQPAAAPKAASRDGDMEVDSEGFPIFQFPPGRVWMLGVNGRNRIGGQQVTVQDIADSLTDRLGRLVINQTGLTGKYDFVVMFSPEGLNPALRGPVGAPPDISDAQNAAEARAPLPTIFDALQSELGLKLEPKKAPMGIVVIDHIEKAPVDN